MDYQIKGKLAFVTAGAHGIGEAIANLLAQEGVSVIVADQDEAALKEKGGAWRATFAANLATAGRHGGSYFAHGRRVWEGS